MVKSARKGILIDPPGRDKLRRRAAAASESSRIEGSPEIFRMRILLLVLALFASAVSGAAESRRFAVLSLIGDKLLVAQYTTTNSFQADQGLQAFVSLDDNSLDKTALQ